MLLALETIRKGFSLALFEEGHLKAQAAYPLGDQAASLLPEIQTFLRGQHLRPSALSGLAVCRGPGAFTGIRIGLSCAYGLALGLGIPASGISALHAFAFQAENPKNLPVLSVVDSHAGSLYMQMFFENMAQGEPLHIPKGALHQHVPKAPFIAAGDGWPAALLPLSQNSVPPAILNAVSIGQLALETNQNIDFPKKNIEALYIKPPYVTVPAA